tara:strand:+ start:1774 stop:2094 length:321 start_codon:yes stop_codon:yes gene_type:complete
MNEGEIFIKNLVAALEEDDLNEAELSRRAGLNRRAVTDLREGRVQSPKLSTVFKLAKALNRDPGEMMGLGARPKISTKVADYLSQFDEDSQEQLLNAVLAMRSLHT